MRIPVVAALGVCAVALVTAPPVLALTAGATTTATKLGGTGCPAFPANNYWNTDISKLPVDKHSSAWLKHMSAATKNLHPDFGPSYGAQPVPYGIPWNVVGDGHHKVRVHFRYASESDDVRYPIGKDTKIEGGAGATGDRHAIVVNKDTCRLYELYDLRHTSTGWHAGSGATWSLTSNKLRPNGWTSADAAGLPILPGLLRLGEVRSGSVTHAIRFTTDITDTRHVWPARHDAGSVSNHNYPPMGARFRLRSSYSLHGLRPDTKVVLRAMKHFGLVLADNGSPWYFQGVSQKGWPSGMLDQLKQVPASAFVAVDTSSLEVSPDSGRAG